MEMKQPKTKISENKSEDYKIRYASTSGTKVDIYPDRLEMRKLVYVDELNDYRRLMREIDISEVPEDERERVKQLQNRLIHAVKDLKNGKIQDICEGF